MRYILFLEELDCFNTEQCCAFLYKLMEYVYIARKTKRTLVIPNIYLTPRDNERIVNEKKVVIKKIEYINLDNFINLDKLKQICDLITPTEYFNNILDNDIKSILINKPNREIPYMNNKIFTYIGKIEIVDVIEYEFNSINILNILNNEVVDEFESLIVYDYNRMGNPNWQDKVEYNVIRSNIKFNKYLYDMGDKFIKENNINNESTLMFHWRRGDKANITKTHFHMTAENETVNWFKHFDMICSIENVQVKLSEIIDRYDIKQILLITNNGDNNEMEDLKLFLEYKKVKLIELNKKPEYINLEYHVYDIYSIICGSKCKYHLHSPTNYNRMSMFGKWIIEEKENRENIYFLY